MLINELFERSVYWDKRLAHFLGDCSKRCFTVTMWFSVLIDDRGRQLRPLMLSISAWKVYPMRLANWFRREMDLFNLGSLLHGMSCCLVHWSWEINLWSCNYDLPGKQKPELIWYGMITMVNWIHVFGPPCNNISRTWFKGTSKIYFVANSLLLCMLLFMLLQRVVSN